MLLDKKKDGLSLGGISKEEKSFYSDLQRFLDIFKKFDNNRIYMLDI